MNELILAETKAWLPVISSFIPKITLEKASFVKNSECQIPVSSDSEAAYFWLNLYKDVPKTYDAYKREVTRLLLWCTYERGVSLEQLKVQDFEAYFHFLKNPPAGWCATRSELREGRTSNQWRPFVGPLKHLAFSTAVRIINVFLNYLVEARYLRSNPIKLLRKEKEIGFSLSSEEAKYRIWERMLEADEWEMVQVALEAMPESNKNEIAHKMRTQFLFALGYIAGLRIHEMANPHWNAFRKLDGLWFLFIRGKGGKPRDIPVNDQLLSFMKVYRLSLNKLPFPTIDEEEPLFISKRTGKALSIRQLYNLVKTIGKAAVKKFEDNPIKAAKLRKFSTHWLRHMCASHQDKEDIPPLMTGKMLGHSSEAITRIYRHSENKRRHEEMQKMKLQVVPRLIELKPEAKETVLILSFKGRPMDKVTSLGRLLDFVEQYILQGFTWERKDFTKEDILQRFEQRKQYGREVIVSYGIKKINKETTQGLIKSILRECEIRLLQCDIKEAIF